jgi:glycosyltransferase involved in cell wall biosynthesis
VHGAGDFVFSLDLEYISKYIERRGTFCVGFTAWEVTLMPETPVKQFSSAPETNRLRILWVQNVADHYFSEMIDELNAQSDMEFVAGFMCPRPPQDSVYMKLPRYSPHLFLGEGQPLRLGRIWIPRLRPDARTDIMQLNFDGAIIGGYDVPFKLWIARYCRQLGVPCLLFADSNLRSERYAGPAVSLKRMLKRVFLSRLGDRFDGVIPVNRFGRAYWRYYGWPGKKIFQSSYYCSLDSLKAARMTDRGEILKRYALDPAKKIVFTAARLAPEKGLNLMMSAFMNSGLAQKDWVWVIAGSGPLQARLESAAGDLFNRAIRFLGLVKPADIPALARHSELFVLPSTYEPHGIVVSEAMGVGTPVIASSACGAASDLVKPGISGWLFENRNAQSLLQALQKATDDPSPLTAMRGSCLDVFESWYDRYSPVNVIPGVMKELIQAGKSRRRT